MISEKVQFLKKKRENVRLWIFHFTRSCQVTSITYFLAFVILKFHHHYLTRCRGISSPHPWLVCCFCHLLIHHPFSPSPSPSPSSELLASPGGHPTTTDGAAQVRGCKTKMWCDLPNPTFPRPPTAFRMATKILSYQDLVHQPPAQCHLTRHFHFVLSIILLIPASFLRVLRRLHAAPLILGRMPVLLSLSLPRASLPSPRLLNSSENFGHHPDILPQRSLPLHAVHRTATSLSLSHISSSQHRPTLYPLGLWVLITLPLSHSLHEGRDCACVHSWLHPLTARVWCAAGTQASQWMTGMVSPPPPSNTRAKEHANSILSKPVDPHRVGGFSSGKGSRWPTQIERRSHRKWEMFFLNVWWVA